MSGSGEPTYIVTVAAARITSPKRGRKVWDPRAETFTRDIPVYGDVTEQEAQEVALVKFENPYFSDAWVERVRRVKPGSQMSGRKDWDPRQPKRKPKRGSVLPYTAPDIADYLDAYLDTALMFTNDVETGESLERYTTQDIAPETMEKMLAEAFAFLEQHHESIGYRLAQAGHDFWRTRNDDEHGFGDGDWPARAESRLVRGAKRFGPFPLKVGPDGMIHHVPTGSSAAMSGRKDWDPRPLVLEPQYLEAFLEGYLHAALLDAAPDDPLRTYSVDAIAPDTLRQIEQDAKQFLGDHWELLRDEMPLSLHNLRGAGQQFYAARNKYEGGFDYWPGPESVKQLREAAQQYGPQRLYIGPDDVIRSQEGLGMAGRKDWDPRATLPARRGEPVTPQGVQDYLDAYLEAALWAETDPETEVSLENYSTEDIAPDTMEKLLNDAFSFLEANHEDIGGRLSDAGHDFWLTRQGHGSGFWDGDWPEPAATRLTDASKEFGEVTLMVGLDGKIHAL